MKSHYYPIDDKIVLSINMKISGILKKRYTLMNSKNLLTNTLY